MRSSTTGSTPAFTSFTCVSRAVTSDPATKEIRATIQTVIPRDVQPLDIFPLDIQPVSLQRVSVIAAKKVHVSHQNAIDAMRLKRLVLVLADTAVLDETLSTCKILCPLLGRDRRF